jgi:Protein of unknown function (DUF1329)
MLLGATLLVGSRVWAQDIPTPAYNPNAYKDLADANSPDTIRPGTVITTKNWTQYKKFMGTWMQAAYGAGMHFHVGDDPNEYGVRVEATTSLPPPKSVRDNTEKYAGQTKLVPDPTTGGFTWTGYQAGVPFPKPSGPNIAAQIMYNTWAGVFDPYVFNLLTHNWETDKYGNVSSVQTDDTWWRLMHLSSPGKPMNLPYAAGNFKAARYIEQAPEQAKYTTSLELTPDDPTKLTEEYVFLPSLRRSLRLSSVSRCSPILGTDYVPSDSTWVPGFFKPQYLGLKKILVPFADANNAWAADGGKGYTGGDFKPGANWPGWPKPKYNHWELRDVYIINMQPTKALGPSYCYGQRIFYIDRENWITYVKENYDRTNRLYKFETTINAPFKYHGETVVSYQVFAFSNAIDLENSHASPDFAYNFTFDEGVPARVADPSGATPGGLAAVMR